MSVDDLLSRFRPNLVVSGNGIEPYAEDDWCDVTIGVHKFKVSRSLYQDTQPLYQDTRPLYQDMYIAFLYSSLIHC